MNRSESIKELSLALSKAQLKFSHAKKDVYNQFFKTNYADLASVIDAAKKPLSDEGLAVSQIVDTDENGNIYVETILMHSSGEFISGKYPIRPTKTDPQSFGSAIAYARRYSFSSITGIAADDDDGEAASEPAKEKRPGKRVETPILDERMEELVQYCTKLIEELDPAFSIEWISLAREDQELMWKCLPYKLQQKGRAILDEVRKKELKPEQDI